MLNEASPLPIFQGHFDSLRMQPPRSDPAPHSLAHGDCKKRGAGFRSRPAKEWAHSVPHEITRRHYNRIAKRRIGLNNRRVLGDRDQDLLAILVVAMDPFKDGLVLEMLAIGVGTWTTAGRHRNRGQM